VLNIIKLANQHISKLTSGSSSFGRAIAFQAIGGEFEPRLPLFVAFGQWYLSLCSSGVEHFLGREEVVSSILTNGSKSYFGAGWIFVEKYKLIRSMVTDFK
jgi:hypothetical protein